MSKTPQHTLGRGQVFFNPFEDGTLTPTNERYLMSTSVFDITASADILVHSSMEQANVFEDNSAILGTNYSGTLTTEDINVNNLAMFLIGDSDPLTVAGGSVVGEVHNSAEQDTYIQLGASLSGSRNITSVVVKDDAATTFVLNTDYTVDLALGRVYIVSGGGISNGTNLRINYTESSYTRDQVVISPNKRIEGQLRFISDNAKGANKDYFMPRVLLSPNGSISLKGESWQALPFNLNIMQLDSDTAPVIVDGRPLL